MKIEISFDDGHILDLKAAQICEKFGFFATFYIPGIQLFGTQSMSLSELAFLHKRGHIIGGHTVSHFHDLKEKEEAEIDFEIRNNKVGLEFLVTEKKPLEKFCYPRGRHNEKLRERVRLAGYKEARTTLVGFTSFSGDPFETPTTVHMFPRKEYNGVDWLKYGKEKLEEAKLGGMFSIWGHSKELEVAKDWGKFEEMLGMLKELT